MKTDQIGREAKPAQRRLPKADRHRQLLDTALQIIRDEGADRLTLGHLATCAGVSKPIAYDHFGTRSALLIDLYRSMDADRAEALRVALADKGRSLADAAQIIAAAYVHCSAETSGEWHAVAAAVAGSPEKDAVYQELLDNYVTLFATALKPHAALRATEMKRRCIGLVGAGEALTAAMVRGDCSEAEAAKAFARLIEQGVK